MGQYIPPDPTALPSALSYTFAAADVGVAILLNYGYIPADLEQVCLEMLSERAVYRRRPGVRSQTLASQESMTYSLTGFSDFEMMVLNRYVNVLPPPMGGLV
jgi:hypothetical protein